MSDWRDTRTPQGFAEACRWIDEMRKEIDWWMQSAYGLPCQTDPWNGVCNPDEPCTCCELREKAEKELE